MDEILIQKIIVELNLYIVNLLKIVLIYYRKRMEKDYLQDEMMRLLS